MDRNARPARRRSSSRSSAASTSSLGKFPATCVVFLVLFREGPPNRSIPRRSISTTATVAPRTLDHDWTANSASPTTGHYDRWRGSFGASGAYGEGVSDNGASMNRELLPASTARDKHGGPICTLLYSGSSQVVHLLFSAVRAGKWKRSRWEFTASLVRNNETTTLPTTANSKRRSLLTQ